MTANDDEVLATLVSIFAEVLGVENVGPESDFFRLGGDSVAATVLMVRIEEEWGILLDPIEVFDRPEVRDFAKVVADAAGCRQPGAPDEVVL